MYKMNIWINSLLIFVLLSVASIPVFAGQKIGAVDMEQVMHQLPQVNELKERLPKEAQSRMDKLKQEQKKLGEMQKMFDITKDYYSEKEKIKEQEAIRSKMRDIQLEERNILKMINDYRSKEFKVIEERVRHIVMQVAAKNGFELVVSRRSVVFSDSNIDITNEVLAAAKKL